MDNIKTTIYKELMEKAKSDQEFFNKLINEPHQILSEINITDAAIREQILSMTPEKAFYGVFALGNSEVVSHCCHEQYDI
ncbi:hypothetical protein [Paenibacillus riograndensis]|uniref:Nif11 domain-containing protein n=1 Tax=Paenibacillus riograndensis SBR5 TaxID=1073571 RepID=A0A0E4CVW6_9BACL|nr:hypothetical protein [Paenibacillus riograndensis]CQR54626.1 hypothetical protein PRIO_2217 [Paenibacillus riograndensis SBR5]